MSINTESKHIKKKEKNYQRQKMLTEIFKNSQFIKSTKITKKMQ